MNFGYKKLYIGGELRDAVSGAKQEVICTATEKANQINVGFGI